LREFSHRDFPAMGYISELPMSPTSKFSLAWSEVEEVAKEAFSRTLFSSSEVMWAQAAWGQLAKAGLCSYESEPERCKCVIRFISLALIHNDFCSIAMGESFEPTYY